MDLYFLWTCNHKIIHQTTSMMRHIIKDMFSGHGSLSLIQNEPLFSFQWKLCFAQMKWTSHAFWFLWASVLLLIPSEILFSSFQLSGLRLSFEASSKLHFLSGLSGTSWTLSYCGKNPLLFLWDSKPLFSLILSIEIIAVYFICFFCTQGMALCSLDI